MCQSGPPILRPPAYHQRRNSESERNPCRWTTRRASSNGRRRREERRVPLEVMSGAACLNGLKCCSTASAEVANTTRARTESGIRMVCRVAQPLCMGGWLVRGLIRAPPVCLLVSDSFQGTRTAPALSRSFFSPLSSPSLPSGSLRVERPERGAERERGQGWEGGGGQVELART
eukprot:scaffold96104_cov30-Tisochrysis_lutea.AAC.1